MQRAYPASGACRYLLNWAPKPSCCLVCKDQNALQSLAGTIVFLRLTDGSGIWYRIERAEDGQLLGYALSDGRWRYLSLAMGRVRRYY